MLVQKKSSVVLLFLSLVSVTPFFVFAQSEEYATVASPVTVEGHVNDKDIISYNVEKNEYRASRSFSDETMFGVVVDDPVLYMDSETARSENVRPVVRYGEVVVNVSDLGGEIVAGDLITTSPIPGIGQETSRQDAPYILGFALEPVRYTGQTVLYGDREVKLGTVTITLRIGPFLTREGANFVASGTKGLEALIKEQGLGFEATPEEVTGFKIFRFFLAAMVVISSMLVSVGRFGETFKESVVSIGRNPLARSQIRSILLWNVLSIVLVTGAGLAIAIAIILFP